MRWVSRYSESVTRIEGSTMDVRDFVVRFPLHSRYSESKRLSMKLQGKILTFVFDAK